MNLPTFPLFYTILIQFTIQIDISQNVFYKIWFRFSLKKKISLLITLKCGRTCKLHLFQKHIRNRCLDKESTMMFWMFLSRYRWTHESLLQSIRCWWIYVNGCCLDAAEQYGCPSRIDINRKVSESLV